MSSSQKVLLTILLALLLQSLNLTVIGPAFARLGNEAAGNLGYAAIRISLIIGFAFASTRYLGFTRFRTIAWLSLVEFLTQVPVKGFYIHALAKQDPATWGNPDFGSLTVGLGMGYALFFPLIFGLSYVGAELGLRRGSKLAPSLERPPGIDGTPENDTVQEHLSN